MTCVRCASTTLIRDHDGDLACLNCGGRIYSTPPLPYSRGFVEPHERKDEVMKEVAR